ncbi:MAG: hypothetical protein ACFCD0_18310 [Gemmataceae bacterium]
MTDQKYTQEPEDACELEMNVGRPMTKAAKKLLFFAGLGFLAILFGGAILAIVTTLLAFALVGFAVWIPFDVWLNGERAILFRGIRRVKQWTAQTKEYVMHPEAVGGKIRYGLLFLLPFILETLCGAGVGCLLVYMGHPRPYTEVAPWILTGTAGAAVGFLFALSDHVPHSLHEELSETQPGAETHL